MNRTALFISIISSILLTVFLWNICPSFVKGVGRLIYSYEYNIPTWILFHGIFALSFGLIPFWSFLIWRYGKYSSILTLITHSFVTFTLSIIISGYIFLLFAENTEPQVLWGQYSTSEDPIWNKFVMNFAIPLSVFIPTATLLIIAFAKRRRKQTTPEELDQSAVS